MTIEQAVLKNMSGLPPIRKQEVLEFTEFLTAKENGDRDYGSNKVTYDLTTLNDDELVHLEKEFENYEQLFPRR